jgi:hypothetical protein
MRVIGEIPEFSGGFFNAAFSEPKKKDSSRHRLMCHMINI